ncbi:hypothetical protein XccvBFoX4_gp74 [Xanthomonas phage FoX4]|uniref:Uncharacterized protein n=1 Tax=Xanthomonas phage FoX4 TaxID=2723900 RepID=A0A858WP43_9CAUD|nr:hypothetical protein KNU97_gp74 [Xanthomonas phage FoX4]QJI53028.1 hypothetical protein XccvBFoX4_gp74 [Xanthomonas phage FoX4]
MEVNELEIFRIAQAFCTAMVWADGEEGTRPRVPKETQIAAQQYVHAFVTAFPQLSRAALDSKDYGWWQGEHNTYSAFGHDLYLTAAGHGAGFADREELGDTALQLDEALWANGAWQRWEVSVYQSRGWMYLE